MTAELIMFAVAVFFSALFSGYETAFVTSNPIRLKYMADEEKNVAARRLLSYRTRPQQMLTTILLGTNISNVAATISVALAALTALQNETLADVLTLVCVSPLILIFGEIVPKSVFRAHPNRLAMFFLPFMRLFYVIIWPVAYPLSTVSTFVTGGREREGDTVSALMLTSVEDVKGLVDESAEHGTIEPEEREMIHSVIELQETQAKEIMMPRIDIQALPKESTREELMELFTSTGRSRIPIYENDIDHIMGVINVRDVMLDADYDNPDITRFVHEVKHVPDSMRVDDLLKYLRESQVHMAIVHDEYGGTHGLATLEDILEEIFGEIQDEHDIEERRMTAVGKNAFVIDARIPLVEAAEFMNVIIDDEEVDSVGGWLMHAAGRIPHQGEIVEHDGYRITVLEGGANSVSRIRVDITGDVRRRDAT